MLAVLLLAIPLATAVTARWSYEEAYDNVAHGDWYRDYDNESATLAWGESYVMMSLAAMYRATGDPRYLERLAWHADGVLAQRDDARGVSDYRGVSAACWRNTSYQSEPYCYVVHSGMIAYPLAEFARLVQQDELGEELAYDGISFAEKAQIYAQACAETVAAHDDQWDDEGFYRFRQDASFLDYAGVDLPLNQSNAMGRLLLALRQVTGGDAYLDKASGLAARFKDQLSLDGEAYVWNYWGGSYSAYGEDVSHAAINVDFAVLCAEQGVVFDETDLERFAATLLDNVLVDDRTSCDQVGGGSTNGSSYRPQIARWLRLGALRTGIYTGVRTMYDLEYPPSAIGSGSTLLGWGLLAELEPLHCPPSFYYVDWLDEDPHSDESWRQAAAYGANVLTLPPDFAENCMLPLEVDVSRSVQAQQWDGSAYHTVATWQATAGEEARFLPYDTRWPYVYWDGMVLFQFADSFVDGDGIRVRGNPGFDYPAIISAEPGSLQAGESLGHQAAGTGDAPFWWSLAEFPAGARVDPGSGALTWTPAESGSYPFTLRLENDAGGAEQSFELEVVSGGGDSGGAGDSEVPGDSEAPGNEDSAAEGGVGPDEAAYTAREGGCGCSGSGVLGWGWLLGMGVAVRRALYFNRSRKKIRGSMA